MMTTVHGNMYGDESLFASVARDVTAMVSRVNDIRKWLSAFPDVDRLTTKLKCPASIVNVARKLPSDIARFLTAGANNVAAWASFSSAMAGLDADVGKRGELTANDVDFLMCASEFMKTY
jgi:hypothetical protein